MHEILKNKHLVNLKYFSWCSRSKDHSALCLTLLMDCNAGQDKGIYAWVAANYVLGTLGDNPQETMGIIQLGGVSAQVIISVL